MEDAGELVVLKKSSKHEAFRVERLVTVSWQFSFWQGVGKLLGPVLDVDRSGGVKVWAFNVVTGKKISPIEARRLFYIKQVARQARSGE
jgi:hypothetical protein